MSEKTLFEKYKDKLPAGLTPETINSMPEELVQTIIEESYANMDTVEEDEPEVTEVSSISDSIIKKSKSKHVNEEPKVANSLEEFIESEEEDTSKEDDSIKPESMLKKHSVTDLMNLPMLNGMSTMDASLSYNHFLRKKVVSTYFVALPASGYSANVRGLTIEEVDSIKNSFRDDSATQQKINEIIFSCIVDSTFQFTGLDDFKSKTVNYEIDLLFFGVMICTFGSVNNFKYKCSYCGKEHSIKVDLNTIVQVKGEEALDAIKMIETKDAETCAVNAAFTKKIRAELPATRLVVDLKLPNLAKEDAVNSFFISVDKDANNSSIYSYLNLTESIFLPYFSEDFEVIGYTEISNMSDKYEYLKNMKKEDIKVIEEELSVFNGYRIDMKIDSLKCSNSKCGKENEVDFDIMGNFIHSILTEM